MKPNGNMVVTHTEYCGAVNHTRTGPAGSYLGATRSMEVPLKLPMNPGDGRTFPWLTGVASRFEKYQFTRLSFTYEPTCSTLENGSVALCPIYDPADPMPTDRGVLYNTEGIQRGVVYRRHVLTVPATRLRWKDTMFVREQHEGLQSNESLRATDLGYLAVTLTDTNNKITYGDLFVTYTVELIGPRVGHRSAKCAHITRSDFTTHTGETNVHPAPFGLLPADHADSRQHHSGADTVMTSFYNDTISNIGPTGEVAQCNRLEFLEPFSGLVNLHSRAKQTAINDPLAIMFNDVATDGLEGMSRIEGEKDEHKPWAAVEILHGIKDGVKAIHGVVKVVAQAGDVLDMAWKGLTGDAVEDVALSLSDVSPELIALSGLV